MNQFMNVSADAKRSLDPRRLKFVTENFTASQGLYYVLLGATFLVSPLEQIADVYLKNWPFPPWLVAAILLAALIAGFRWLPKYYETEFGWVERREMEQRTLSIKQEIIFLLALVALLVFGHRNESFLSEMALRFQSGHVSAFLLLWMGILCADFVRHSRQQVDKYGLYFRACVIIACAFVAFCPLWNPGAAQLRIWKLSDDFAVGISLIAVGLYDHFALIRLLPQRISEDDQ